ncbi:DNA polymerase IV [Striga asiatica]|uniref:DNA repair protein REV1 n=1 Tax=Striga asiatica TaxID=4170 RepID=A0A5A7P025_STRAF|nr:DNA polymerase IV [Striga asiatica]
MSLDSGSKSKRSFKSISSNPYPSNNSNSDGRGSNKKKTTAQKTLGMAWGANSRSSSRSAFRNSPFSDFGSYMVVKNQKLHEQFKAAASSSSHSAPSSEISIFNGVSIFVDGYTVPSSQELRGYMLKYGGRFENYFSRKCVTHIICSNLPDIKIKNLRSFSGGLPVVKPAWVLDSVAANKLLNWIPYQLDQLVAENNNQSKLSAFFTPETSGASEAADQRVDLATVPENENQSLTAGLSENSASLEAADRCNLGLNSEEPACSVESSCEVKGVELTGHLLFHEQNSDLKLKSSTSQASVSLNSNKLDKHDVSDASSSGTILPRNERHSTLADPNFVENYFKSSRLHFIGTWRNRYRKRFNSLSDCFRQKSSSLSTAAANEKNATIHIDMDCFFVSVVTRNHPELLDKPVAVCHSDNPRGTAEISSANYPARDHGVKAGMFVKDAKVRCPQLVIVPYDFGAYELVADQFYDILHRHCNKVQAVSCDEAFLDVSESEVGDPQLLASTIRKEIFETTGCTASAGIAGNMLMARLATKTAKPNGQCYIPFDEVDNYLQSLPVKALPGIGHVLEGKLKQKQIKTCGQLRLISKESLQKDFGMKTGEMLWKYSRGVDNRLVGVIQESKSVGAEVNWGVRFRNLNDTQHFLENLCKEVALRLRGCGVQGRAFTLKVKKKKSDAGEPIKYMGCGNCENLSHSITIPMATDEVDVIKRLASQLFGYFHIDVKDVRGVGLQVSKLESTDDSKLGGVRDQIPIGGVSNLSNAGMDILSGQPSITRSYDGMGSGLSSSEAGGSLITSLPPLEDLDIVVLESLPPEVVSEMNDMYGGKLLSHISKAKNRPVDRKPYSTSQSVPVEETEYPLAKTIDGDKEMELCVQAPTVHDAMPSFSVDNLLPSSLSQVDHSVLKQLPDELRKDIIEHLPQHREQESAEGSSSYVIDKQTECAASELSDLWSGSPPKWVERFERSNCTTLNSFAMNYRLVSGGNLSTLLQHMMSGLVQTVEVANSASDDTMSWLCELFKQYVNLKITTDVEEIYLCICLLKRLAVKSEIFLQVFNGILPHLQVLSAPCLTPFFLLRNLDFCSVLLFRDAHQCSLMHLLLFFWNCEGSNGGKIWSAHVESGVVADKDVGSICRRTVLNSVFQII